MMAKAGRQRVIFSKDINMIRYFIILTFSLPVFSKGYINIANIPNKCSMGYYDNNKKIYRLF